MNCAANEIYQTNTDRNATSDFWSEAKAAAQKVSLSRFKQLPNSEHAESLALTIWENMTQDQFTKIQSIDCMIIKEGEIKTNDMIEFLQQSTNKSGISVEELRAIHPCPSEATLHLVHQILGIFNKNIADISDDENNDKRPKSVPCRLDQVLETARNLGLGEIILPPSVYVNERARLAMIERQIKGKIKLKNLHEKLDKVRGLSIKVDKPTANKNMDIKRRIRRVLAIREKMRADNNENNTQPSTLHTDSTTTTSTPPENKKFYFGTEPPKPPGPAVIPEVYPKPIVAAESTTQTKIWEDSAAGERFESECTKTTVAKKEFSEQFEGAHASASEESLADVKHEIWENVNKESHQILNGENSIANLEEKFKDPYEMIKSKFLKFDYGEHGRNSNGLPQIDGCAKEPVAELYFNPAGSKSKILNGIDYCLNDNIKLENLNNEKNRILNIVDDLKATQDILINGTNEIIKQDETQSIHSGMYQYHIEPKIVYDKIKELEESYERKVDADDEDKNSMADDTYEGFTYPDTTSSAVVRDMPLKDDEISAYTVFDEYDEEDKTDVSSSDSAIVDIHVNIIEQNSSQMFTKIKREKVLEANKESNFGCGTNIESLHDSKGSSQSDESAPRMCEMIRERRSRTPFDMYKHPIVLRSSKGGPCTDNSRKFLQDEDNEVFVSAPDVNIKKPKSKSKYVDPPLPIYKEVDILDYLGESQESMNLRRKVSSSDLLGLDESAPLLETTCSLVLEETDESSESRIKLLDQKSTFSVNNCSPASPYPSRETALQPEKKEHKTERKTSREVAIVVLVSVVLGIGSYSYFSTAGQKYFSSIFKPASVKAIQVVERAASLFRSLRHSKL